MTETTTYTVQPGTIAARVLAWFADQAPELEASSGVIAEALDQPIAAVITALDPVFEHGLIAREKREGRLYWSVGHSKLRSLAAPPRVCADDDYDDAPFVRRTVPANKSSGVSLVDVPAWSPPKETTMPSQPPVAPPQAAPKPKKVWNAAPAFDPLKIEVKTDRPIPPMLRGPGAVSPYKVLLDRLQPGQSVDLPKAAAKSLMGVAKKAGIKIACRQLDDVTTGIWKL